MRRGVLALKNDFAQYAQEIAAAALIIKGWPSTAAWALGVGINLITSGLAVIMVALAGRSLVRTVASATH